MILNVNVTLTVVTLCIGLLPFSRCFEGIWPCAI